MRNVAQNHVKKELFMYEARATSAILMRSITKSDVDLTEMDRLQKFSLKQVTYITKAMSV